MTLALVHWSRSQPYFRYGLYQYCPEAKGTCGHCRAPASTIDWSFQCFVCSPACTEAMWNAYADACRDLPVVDLDICLEVEVL